MSAVATGSDDIRALGDMLARLTVAEAKALVDYLAQRHGIVWTFRLLTGGESQ